MLISPTRFDLMAKYLYIKFREKNTECNFHKEMYHKHLQTFNNCFELQDPSLPSQKPKKSIEDFITSFDALIDSMKANGFDNNYPITLGSNNVIVNGAHRLTTAYFYNLKPAIEPLKEAGNMGYNYSFFLNRQPNPPLHRTYADAMALEYINHNPNLRAMVVYPTAFQCNKFKELNHIIRQYGYVYYDKSVNLNPNGINNLIKEMYRGEEWIGGMFPQGFSPGGKAQRCISEQPSPTILILVHMNDLSKCVELKEKCRELFGLGKHSLHISDYTEDTFRIAASLLNENSIDFLNRGTNDITPSTKQLLANYFKTLSTHSQAEKEDYCLTSSLIMEMYGLRQAKDVDYLHRNNKTLGLGNTGVHDGKWLSYYHAHKDEIIYNPAHHFYLNGFKFASLNVIEKMKENRKEPKDVADIAMIRQRR